MDPAIIVTSAWNVAKTAAEISKKLYEFGKSLKDRDAKQQVEDMLDKLRELKQSASELEDENRGLREKLRFKSGDFECRPPFWYEKSHPDRPLCPKCFANRTASPMDQPGRGCNGAYRRCWVCDSIIETTPHSSPI